MAPVQKYGSITLKKLVASIGGVDGPYECKKKDHECMIGIEFSTSCCIQELLLVDQNITIYSVLLSLSKSMSIAYCIIWSWTDAEMPRMIQKGIL